MDYEYDQEFIDAYRDEIDMQNALREIAFIAYANEELWDDDGYYEDDQDYEAKMAFLDQLKRAIIKDGYNVR